MKKTLFVILIFCSVIGLHASDWITIQSVNPAPAEFSLINSNNQSSTVQFRLDGFWKSEVETTKGTAWLINVDGGGAILKTGAPDLPRFATSLIIPDKAAMKIQVLTAEFQEIRNVLIAPSKGNLTRDIDPETVPYEYGKYYSTDAEYPAEISKLDEPYIVRDYRGQALIIQPFQYNPVTRILKVYYNITVKIVEDGVSSYNTIQRASQPAKINSQFKSIYTRHFINFNDGSRYNQVDEEGKMIIISYGDFIDEIQPLVDWKNKKGLSCSVVDVASIGSSNDIKQYIADAYDSDDIAYVLLVGDAAQVPTYILSGDASDNSYSYIVGNDHYPDLFIGRFSAENEEQVSTMVNRTLTYEINPVSDTAWYTKAIGIASSQGPGDDNEMDFEHIRNIGNNKLIPFTYNYAYEFFDGSQGGEDAAGNPTPNMVAAAVNSGASIINYTGHGSTTSWGSSGFSSNNVNSLTNTGKWPFIISVACVNGDFDGATCFAEAWLRATDNDEPAGAIATLMASVNQSWDPPMCGQDAMNDIMIESYTDNIKRTFGGITMNGCMEMNDTYGSSGTAETDYWTIFGDPSLVVRTAIPAEMTVSHPASLPMGATSVSVMCDAEGGLVALSVNGNLLSTAMVIGGVASLEFTALDEPGTADIVVSAFNYRPYISTIEIVPTATAYITFADFAINDAGGNDNGLLDYAEQVDLTIDLTNIGEADASDVLVEISSQNPNVTINTSTANYGSIPAGDTLAIENAFNISVAENVPDGELITFGITAEDQAGRSVWESGFSIEAHAPALSYVSFVIDDSEGNGNGKIDPGENADVIISFANQGTSDAFNVSGQLTTDNEYISIYNEQQMVGDLSAGENSELTFQVMAGGDTPEGTSVSFSFDLIADHNISGDGEFFMVIGQIPVYVLNLAKNNEASDSISMCLNSLHVGAEYGSQMAENLDMYRSVFVILGVYPDNNALTEEQGENLANYLQNGGCVYLEGGDTWAFDDQTPAHEMFHIEGLSDGSDDLSVINGEPGGFLSDYSFVYNGPNNYIDKIQAGDGATLLMSNENPNYGVGVSYQTDTYKTVGASFSFSGLQNEGGNKKDGVMAEILNFFGIGFTWTAINDLSVFYENIEAYPNPFKQEVNIRFTMPEKSKVNLEIYDITGRKINTLIDGELSEGRQMFKWDATDLNSMKVQPGIYFYKLSVGNHSVTKKLILTN